MNAIRPSDPLAPARAFTLIEVMLAVAIFAIVLVAIHTVFYGAIQLRNKTTEAVEEQLPVEQALAIMKRDLANVVLPGGTFFGQLQTSLENSPMTNNLDLMDPVNDAIPGQSGPAFYTCGGSLSDDEPWGDVERVSYYLAAPTNNIPGKVLMRSVTRNLLPPMPDQPKPQPLLSGVQNFFVSFYDGIQWRDYWDSTQETNKLPYGFKIQLQLLARDSDRLPPPPIEMVVPVVLQVGTNSTNQASGGQG